MPTKTVLYLSGPMSGRHDFNFAAFDEAAARLRDAGYRVLNPADFGAKERHTWRDCLCRDLGILAHADGVALLPGWSLSKGANLERDTALALGMEVLPIEAYLYPDEPASQTVSADTVREPGIVRRIVDCVRAFTG